MNQVADLQLPHVMGEPLFDAVTAAYHDDFTRTISDPKQLAEAHSRLTKGEGIRGLQSALNRSIVALSVAAWQAYAQALARAWLDSLGVPDDWTQAGRTLTAIWQGRQDAIEEKVRRFNTPDAANTVTLLTSVGFDPRPHWEWTHGSTQVGPGQAEHRLNQWVKARHAIAHGGTLPTNLDVLTVNDGEATVRKSDAEACLGFIERLAEATNKGARETAWNAAGAESWLRFNENITQGHLSATARRIEST